ncbi:MAG TPA: hypothetical protein VMH84_07870 [Xanthobacteraceae bacterium]|nr:hypothetical protein [Xanthobacteraceae bacterium]
MAHIAQDLRGVRRRPQASRAALSGLMLRLALIAGILTLAGCPVAYILWPRWPDQVALDAPMLPITVGGLSLNVPPATIRLSIQRRSGAQERLDLVFLWPSLMPPDPAAKIAPGDALQLTDRVFVTIALNDGTPPPLERLKTIYPRYLAADTTAGPDGLLAQGFRNDTPYQGEELFYDAVSVERFLVRCTHDTRIAPGICLHEQRIMNADITVRFPREWLKDWRAVASNIDRLMADLRPNASR